jgi:hypothetical protein
MHCTPTLADATKWAHSACKSQEAGPEQQHTMCVLTVPFMDPVTSKHASSKASTPAADTNGCCTASFCCAAPSLAAAAAECARVAANAAAKPCLAPWRLEARPRAKRLRP